MAEGESSFVAIEAQGTAVVSVDLIRGGRPLRAPRIETADSWWFLGLGDPVQESIRRGYEDAFAFLVDDHGWSAEDAYAVLSAVGDSKLGGPTGSSAPDPLHPFTAIGAVTAHRVPKSVLA
jgi:amidase